MKKLLLLLVILWVAVALGGCTAAKYDMVATGPDGVVTEHHVSYDSFARKFTGLDATFGTARVSATGVQSDVQAINSMLGNLSAILLKSQETNGGAQ